MALFQMEHPFKGCIPALVCSSWVVHRLGLACVWPALPFARAVVTSLDELPLASEESNRCSHVTRRHFDVAHGRLNLRVSQQVLKRLGAHRFLAQARSEVTTATV